VEELLLVGWAMGGGGEYMVTGYVWLYGRAGQGGKEAIVESEKAFEGGIYKELTGRPEPKG
jgi:hypothetical protein